MSTITVLASFNLVYWTIFIKIAMGCPPPLLISMILFLGGYFVGGYILNTGDKAAPTWQVFIGGAIWMMGPGFPFGLDYFLLGSILFY